MTRYWLSTNKMTIGVTVDKDMYVVDAAPIARWAIGKHFTTLEKWLRKQGGFRKVDMKNVEGKHE